MKTRKKNTSTKNLKQQKLNKEEVNIKIVFEARRLQTIITQIKNKLAIERELTEAQGKTYKAKPLSQLYKYNHYYPELGKTMSDYVDYFTFANKHLGLELVYDGAGNIYSSLDKALITLRYRENQDIKLVEITRGYDITIYYENLPLTTDKTTRVETFKQICYPKRTLQDEVLVEKESELFKKICVNAQRMGYVLSVFLPMQIVEDYGLPSVKCTEDYKDHFEKCNLGLVLLTNRSNAGSKETNFSNLLYDLRKAVPLVKWMKSGEIEIYKEGELIEKYREGELIENYPDNCPIESNQLENSPSENNYSLKKSNEIVKSILKQENSSRNWVLIKGQEKNKNVTHPFSFKFNPPAASGTNLPKEPKTISDTNLSYETEKKSYAALYSIFAENKQTNISATDLVSHSKEDKEPNSHIIKKPSQTNEELIKQLPPHAQEIVNQNYHDFDICTYYPETYHFFSAERSPKENKCIDSDFENSIKNTI